MWNGNRGVILSHRCHRENSAVILKPVITDGPPAHSFSLTSVVIFCLSPVDWLMLVAFSAPVKPSHICLRIIQTVEMLCAGSSREEPVERSAGMSHAHVNRISLRLLAKKSIFCLFVFVWHKIYMHSCSQWICLEESLPVRFFSMALIYSFALFALFAMLSITITVAQGYSELQ